MPGHKILLVDDDKPFGRNLRPFLELRGYAVWDAPAGAEALVLAERLQPDLILLEPGLPQGKASQIAQELRRRPTTAGIPIALFAGQPLSGSAADSLARISVGTIPKQATLDRIEGGVRLLLTLRRRAVQASPTDPAEPRPSSPGATPASSGPARLPLLGGS